MIKDKGWLYIKLRLYSVSAMVIYLKCHREIQVDYLVMLDTLYICGYSLHVQILLTCVDTFYMCEYFLQVWILFTCADSFTSVDTLYMSGAAMKR